MTLGATQQEEEGQLRRTDSTRERNGRVCCDEVGCVCGGGVWRDVAGPRVRCGINKKIRLFLAEAANAGDAVSKQSIGLGWR